jgi:hypothetical protein
MDLDSPDSSTHTHTHKHTHTHTHTISHTQTHRRQQPLKTFQNRGSTRAALFVPVSVSLSLPLSLCVCLCLSLSLSLSLSISLSLSLSLRLSLSLCALNALQQDRLLRPRVFLLCAHCVSIVFPFGISCREHLLCLVCVYCVSAGHTLETHSKDALKHTLKTH